MPRFTLKLVSGTQTFFFLVYFCEIRFDEKHPNQHEHKIY
jgi:hypothetical protein